MADQVRPVQYCYVTASDKPGEGAKVLLALKEAGINLQAFVGFPTKGGKAQVDLVAENIDGIKRIAKANKWKLSPVKRAFLVTGDDRVGAVANVLAKLAEAKINVTAGSAVNAGGGRYGLILWVKPTAYSRAAKALGAAQPAAAAQPVAAAAPAMAGQPPAAPPVG